MAFSIVANTTGTATTGNCTLTSWTPVAGESLWLFLAARSTSITPTIAGNGQTFTPIVNTVSAQSQFRIWAWYVASVSGPSTGSIVATLTANTLPVVAACVRVSGQHASTPLDQFTADAGPPVDDNDMKSSIVTTAADALILAWGSYRIGLMNSLGASEVSIVDDLSDGGGGGSGTTASLWYELAGATGSYELGADNSLNSARDWSMILVSVAPAAAGGGGQPAAKRLGQRPFRPVEVGRKSPGGVWCIGSPSPALALARA